MDRHHRRQICIIFLARPANAAPGASPRATLRNRSNRRETPKEHPRSTRGLPQRLSLVPGFYLPCQPLSFPRDRVSAQVQYPDPAQNFSAPPASTLFHSTGQGAWRHSNMQHLTLGYLPVMEVKILDLLKRPDYTPLNADELRARLSLRRDHQRELEQLLARLERSGQIARIKAGNRYALPITADLVPGRIRMNRAGVGFVQPDDPKLPTIRVAYDATGTAMHGDHVLVRRDVLARVPRRPEATEPTGRVVRVLERARTQLVGTLQRGKQFLYVIPDDPRISHDILVPPPRDTGRPANVGDKVVVD